MCSSLDLPPIALLIDPDVSKKHKAATRIRKLPLLAGTTTTRKKRHTTDAKNYSSLFLGSLLAVNLLESNYISFANFNCFFWNDGLLATKCTIKRLFGKL